MKNHGVVFSVVLKRNYANYAKTAKTTPGFTGRAGFYSGNSKTRPCRAGSARHLSIQLEYSFRASAFRHQCAITKPFLRGK